MEDLPAFQREEQLRRLAELAIRAGEKLQGIASAAVDVATDPTIPGSPALNRLKAELRNAGMLHDATDRTRKRQRGATRQAESRRSK
jgi:hypothetical protein